MTTPPEAHSTLQTEAVTLRNARVSFAEVPAVDDLSLQVRPGELFGLVGPDGAGKTTTVRLIAGLLDADTGQVRVLGDAVGDSTRQHIGYMPQRFSLYGDLSVAENMIFFGRLFGLSTRESRRRRERLLHIARLESFTDRRADALSGGMYKKLALSCALLHEPEILLLDEPTNGVDPISRRELWELLNEFVGDGMTVLVTTPSMDEAARCHRVALIHQGKLLSQGPPGELVDDFDHHVIYIEDADRDQLEEYLTDNPDVLAISPHAAGLRLVIRKGTLGALRGVIDQRRGERVPIDEVRPDFEDVFLAQLATAPESAEAPGEETQ